MKGGYHTSGTTCREVRNPCHCHLASNDLYHCDSSATRGCLLCQRRRPVIDSMVLRYIGTCLRLSPLCSNPSTSCREVAAVL